MNRAGGESGAAGLGQQLLEQVRRGRRWLFGDRYGLALWLGLALAFGLTWRIGFFIQDSYATANALVALADGPFPGEQV